MADQVKFLKGSQSNLTTLQQQVANKQKEYVPGAFYLTTDTNRLYYAQDKDNLAHLNQYIRTVSDIAHLPDRAENGDYYYAQTENVLAVWDSGNKNGLGGWTQLNPDTDTNDRINNTSSAITSADVANSNDVVINLNITDDGDTPRSATGSVVLSGGNNVTLSQKNNTITIDAANDINTTYDLDTSTVSTNLSAGQTAVNLTLDASTGTDSNVTFKSANSNLEVTQNNNVITLTAEDQSVDAVNTQFDANGIFKVGVKDANDSDYVVSSGVTPTIAYGQVYDDQTNTWNTTATKVFNGGTASLDVYTRAQVDTEIENALSAADAMKYLGTVYNSDAATKLTSNANWGSVYKAADNISSPVSANTGDLIIAEKTSGSTAADEGTANHTQWVVISSGDDQTISWIANENTGQVGSTDGANGSSIIVAGGTHINVSHSKSGNVLTSTVSQAADYRGQTKDYTDQDNSDTAAVALSAATSAGPSTVEFTAITGIQTDNYGNVVNESIKAQKLTVVDSHANINSVTSQVTSSSNTATVKTYVQDSDLVSQFGQMTVTSDNLSITNNSQTESSPSTSLKINLEWGSF